MGAIHHYRAAVTWQGSTADGYLRYDRSHAGTCTPAAAEIALSAAPSFRGDDGRANPEQLLVLAASSCQLLSFLALAARSGVEVLAYRDDAEGTMEVRAGPMGLGAVELRPVITVAPGTDPEGVTVLVDRAHHECYVANTLSCPIRVTPTVIVADARA